MNDLAEWHLRGPVLILRTEHAQWDAASHRWQPPTLPSTITFRRDGRLSEREVRNPDGSIVREARAYTGAGLLRQVEWSSGGDTTGVTRYVHDAQGRVVRVERLDGRAAARDVEVWTYGAAAGKTRVEFLPDASGDVLVTEHAVEEASRVSSPPGAGTRTTRHGARGYAVEALLHDAHHTLLRRTTFTRDAEGRVLHEELELCEDIPFPELRRALAQASEQERAQVALLLEHSLGPRRTFYSTSYAYDAHGRMAERRSRIGALSEDRTTFSYDRHGNVVAEISESRSRGMNVDEAGRAQPTDETARVHHVRYDYEYDARDNWTARVVSSRTNEAGEYVPSNIERRRIEYYR